MVHQDTVRLLRECDAGIQMGILAIGQVMNRAQDDALRTLLARNRQAHEHLQASLQAALDRFHDAGKHAPLMARAMSTVKTNLELMVSPTDAAIAELITDGCAMGIKSLSRYLNQYAAADESAKDVCKKLIALEEQLAKSLRGYL